MFKMFTKLKTSFGVIKHLENVESRSLEMWGDATGIEPVRSPQGTSKSVAHHASENQKTVNHGSLSLEANRTAQSSSDQTVDLLSTKARKKQFVGKFISLVQCVFSHA